MDILNKDFYETNIERFFREGLEKNGFIKGKDFEIQYPERNGYILDFAFVDKKIDIEVDGENWHSSKKAKKRDNYRNFRLKRSGWKVLRFTGNKVLNNLELCLKEVQEYLK
jgi:very-short-patch-repair endonuclease